MSSSELMIVIGVIVALILLPFLIALAIRWLVPLESETGDEELPSGEVPVQFTSLKDVWTSAVPHLTELRDRLLKALLGIGLGTAIGSWIVFGSPFGKPLPEILVDHFVPNLESVKLQAITPAETFVSYMGIALVIGISLAIPIVLYQIVAFVSPGLLPNEKRALYTSLPFVIELFLAGLAFGWFFTIPTAMDFLLGFGTSDRVISQPSLSSFFSMVSTLALWNGLVFELPAVVYLLARIGLVSTETLSRTRRYAIVVITIVAAIITPTPDPYNMLILAIPMYLLYELGIQLTRLIPRKNTVDGTVTQPVK